MLYSFACPLGASLTVVTGGGLLCSDSSLPVASAVSLQPVGVDPATNFTDGAVLGWGVVAAMAAAYAIHLLRRAL